MDDMMVALADKYLMNTCPCFTPNTARLTRLQQLAKDYDVKGMVYYILQACHTYNIESYNIQKAFKAMGIPVLKIETDYGEQDTGQLKVRMEAFSEMLHGQIG
jgi:benzoyl-CoA reductase/2-hydroxyglutaryl-CoA dehydratase subunit BcrC/BadD/HgdB